MAIPSKSWKKQRPPRRILAIRLHAMGDVVITLPYLQHLRNTLPASTEIDLLTRVETNPVPKNMELFNHIFSIAGKRNFKLQFLFTFLLLPRLLSRRYEMVLDLQNNILSKIVRKIIRPRAWCEFDRTSPIAAGERTRLTIEAAGLTSQPEKKFILKSDLKANEILMTNGWDGSSELVVLNPAGIFSSRSWPLEYYAEFAMIWKKEFPKTQFIITGLPFLEPKKDFLKDRLGSDLICLVGNTDVAEAFSILQLTKFVLSEDSGLMHMAWISGIPTLALFGGSRSDKARPIGENTGFLDSSDLPCGSCMKEVCQWGDNRCLTRYTADMVFEKAKSLL